MPRECSEFLSQPDAIPVWQLDVDQACRWPQSVGVRERHTDTARLSDDGQATRGKQPSREFAELWIVVDYENGSAHEVNDRFVTRGRA